jgi:DNA-binding response OmpR family regulator
LTCRVFQQIFRKRGFTVDIAKDGEEAKNKMKNKTYDASLISFVLPDMNGIDLLFFTTKSMPNAAKIITTGFPTLRDGIKFIEAGADAYFSKPVNPEELLLVVEKKLALPKKANMTPSTIGSPGVASNSNRKIRIC